MFDVFCVLGVNYTSEIVAERKKRYDLPDPGYFTVETVFVVDAVFMNL